MACSCPAAIINDSGFCLGSTAKCSLDRVLCGEADELLVAAQSGREAEEGQVGAGIAFVAVVEPAVVGQPGRGPLDYPPASPEPLGRLDALAGDTDADPLASQSFPQFRYVGGFVGVQALGFEVAAAVGVVSPYVVPYVVPGLIPVTRRIGRPRDAGCGCVSPARWWLQTIGMTGH